jgi:hypothetical protein
VDAETLEVDRLAAGFPPATPDDDEISRLATGAPPQAAEAVLVALSSTGDWIPSTLTGSRSISVGGAKFSIPRDAETKHSRRAGTIWVRIGGETYILSERGELKQTPAERRATRWDLL